MVNDLFLQIIADETVVNSDWDALLKISGKIGVRLVIDFVSVWVLIRLIYFRMYKKSELLFTYFVFNIAIFFICFLLNKVDLSMGAAFGLFAVFSMLRYRTEGISIKDMTYLFLVIAMGLISAVTKIKGAEDSYEYVFILMVNAILIGVTYLLESRVFFKSERVKLVYYEHIERIHASKEDELINDLRTRTGLPITRIDITKIDFLKDAAIIKVYYFE